MERGGAGRYGALGFTGGGGALFSVSSSFCCMFSRDRDKGSEGPQGLKRRRGRGLKAECLTPGTSPKASV